MDRERRLLSDMAVIAGRINKHKVAQKEHESRLLAKVSHLSGLINRHKNAAAGAETDVPSTPRPQETVRSRLRTSLGALRLALQFLSLFIIFLPLVLLFMWLFE